MERDLDATGADVLAETLADLGIRVVRDARVVSLRRSRGELAALQFADDRELACDLLVPAMGTVPRAELARAAGLPVRRGIVVGPDLRSPADARIAAIGDCAEPPEGCLGLVAPGWAQAARLAAQVAAQATGEPVPDAASGAPTTARVVRLKAVGAEAVSLGAAKPPAGSRLLNLVDVAGRRSVTVSVADGRVVSAVCVGSPRTAAALTVSFERGTPVPSDPAWLLVDAGALALAPQANSPATMPGHATVCSCNGVTKGQIVEAHRSGARAVPDVAAVTRATTGCGGCRVTVEGLLDWLDRSDAAPPEPPEQPDQPVRPAVPARADRCETDVARV
jgi:assimilatory nitrate reductase electron transfer subunit